MQPEVSRVCHDGDSSQLSAVTLSYWLRLLMENGVSPSSGDFAVAGRVSVFEKVLWNYVRKVPVEPPQSWQPCLETSGSSSSFSFEKGAEGPS